MRHFSFTLFTLMLLGCTVSNPDPVEDQAEQIDEIIAEKAMWKVDTRASDDRAFAKDIPWKEGDKVMLIAQDQTRERCSANLPTDPLGTSARKILCTVSKAAGLKCTLAPEEPLESGIYRAIYPAYDYTWFDVLHLSFLYEDWHELSSRQQDIVASDPIEYREGHKLSVVLKHIVGLIDININPPRTGNYSYLKLFAQSPVFAGKADYCFDEDYNLDNTASGWLNFTTLRSEGTSMREGELFQTSTGLLPIKYEGMPVTLHIVYDDGTHYVSEPFAMPSLSLGMVKAVEVNAFNLTDEPMQGLWGDYYGDTLPTPYPVN